MRKERDDEATHCCNHLDLSSELRLGREEKEKGHSKCEDKIEDNIISKNNEKTHDIVVRSVV